MKLSKLIKVAKKNIVIVVISAALFLFFIFWWMSGRFREGATSSSSKGVTSSSSEGVTSSSSEGVTSSSSEGVTSSSSKGSKSKTHPPKVGETSGGGVVTNVTNVGGHDTVTIDGRLAGDNDKLYISSGIGGKNKYTWNEVKTGKARWENKHFKVICGNTHEKFAVADGSVHCIKYPANAFESSVQNDGVMADAYENRSKFVNDIAVRENQSNTGNNEYSFKMEEIDGENYVQDQLIQN